MAWTTPRTWVTSEIVTASHMNTHVRDNFNESAPAKATSGSGFIVTTGANTILQRTAVSNEVLALQTTTSTSYTDLTSAGPSVTVTTGTIALVSIVAAIQNNTAGQTSYVGVDISGATSAAANDNQSLHFESTVATDEIRTSVCYIQDGLAAGSNTFKMQYRVSGGTGAWQRRRIGVIPFG